MAEIPGENHQLEAGVSLHHVPEQLRRTVLTPVVNDQDLDCPNRHLI
jgi:hypothetical protein